MARKDVDMTQGSILRHYIGFAAPLMLGLLFQQLYNTVDAAVIGHFGPENALGAVTSTGSIVNMMIGIFNAQRRERIKTVSATNFTPKRRTL